LDEARALALVSTSARVVVPYRWGSRVPKRLRLGPLIRRIPGMMVGLVFGK
jgi:hypothetical protein